MQTYKVFYGKCCYATKIHANILVDDLKDFDSEKCNVLEVEKTLQMWLENSNRTDLFFDCNLETLHRAESMIFRFVEAAGGVVFVDKKMLAIVRHGILDLPKGHLEKDETISEGAIREVIEETAINDLTIFETLPTTYHCYKQKGKWELKKTYWYAMKTSQRSGFVPQYSEGITTIQFFDWSQISEFLKNTYRSLGDTLGNDMIRIFKQIK
ncbi:MAG: NUDIX domain-containing protein [Lentimicrobiaceae bacterium]|jgi:ADP-ribose pyrophosphatase YjhB (NUDIX family)|nr:NUDIX domain-containing protein [Lentimicrobiaceae bacterium]